ncbi:MAG: glucosamine--fructose-6-phosphate aminotransferase [Gammaproteobacteria bacterium]|nr:glucosamine--fructose-6-phosphate aminotransferase [Gammaproteobacteria bacterium]
MPLIDLDLRCCADWIGRGFDAECLRDRLNGLPAGVLPLAGACTQGGLVDESARSIGMLRNWHEGGCGHVRIGVFFGEVVAGCNCNDDPVTGNVYACFDLRIDPHQARTGVTAVED